MRGGWDLWKLTVRECWGRFSIGLKPEKLTVWHRYGGVSCWLKSMAEGFISRTPGKMDSIRCVNKKSRIYGTSDSFAKINGYICQICADRESWICQRVSIGLSRPHTASADLRVRSASHGCCRPWDVRSSGQSHLYRAKQPDRPEDRTLIRPASCGRPIGLLSVRPWEADRTLKSVRPIGLSDRSHDFLVRGRSVRPWESEVRSDSGRCAWEADRTLPSEAMRLAVKISQTGPRIVLPCPESDRTSDSHGLTDLRGRVRERPWSPDWLRQITWQKWEAVRGRERPWEAVGGRVRPWGSHWLR